MASKINAPKPLLDVDLRVRPRLDRGHDLAFVPFGKINLDPKWSQSRYENNLNLLREKHSMPPIFLVYDAKTKMYGIEDGVHRAHAAKDSGFA